MLLSFLILSISLFVVIKSADWFLDAAEKTGKSLHLPEFLMGVILVGFGTSLPEFATSIAAISSGENSITLANVTGSNIANIFLVIGISTIIAGTIKIAKKDIDLDLSFLFIATVLSAFVLIDGQLTRIDGLILFTGFIGYMTYSVLYDPKKAEHTLGFLSFLKALMKKVKLKDNEKNTPKIELKQLLVMFASVIALSIASKYTVDSVLNIVTELDIAVEVISFFALAIGTSLPELVVSIKSIREGKGDLALGNIIGSCIFNILLIGGFASILSTQYIDTSTVYWIVAGLIGSVLLLVVSAKSRQIEMWEGAGFVLVYIALSLKII